MNDYPYHVRCVKCGAVKSAWYQADIRRWLRSHLHYTHG